MVTVPLVACRPRLPLSCFVETVLRFLLRTKYKHTDAHANTQIHARVLSPFRPVFVCLVLNRTHASGIRPSTSSPPLHPGAHLSLFPRSLFPRQFSTSSLSSLASSCVIQLKNIRSSRPAINIPCPPKTVRIIIFLIITVVFL